MDNRNETAEPSGASGGSIAPQTGPVCSVNYHNMQDEYPHFSYRGMNKQHWWIPDRFRYVGCETPKQLRTWWQWLTMRPRVWQVTFQFEELSKANAGQ